MMLTKVTALSENVDFCNAFAATVRESANMVCSVCGLARVGHAPESIWLGYIAHDWAGIPANAGQLARAEELTSEAYGNRRDVCGHRFESYKCRTACVHVEGHCKNCSL